MSTLADAVESALEILNQRQEPRLSNLIAQAPGAETGRLLSITFKEEQPMHETVANLLAVDMLAHIIEMNPNPNVEYNACVVVDGSRAASAILDDVAKKLKPAVGHMMIPRGLDSLWITRREKMFRLQIIGARKYRRGMSANQLFVVNDNSAATYRDIIVPMYEIDGTRIIALRGGPLDRLARTRKAQPQKQRARASRVCMK